ncbi:MAG: methyltransferase domain-containing protein [Betaproteobacteria bacterium]|nr:methyltransferase domain-containing protein [Betaproteobacteria bacterium]
MIRAWLGLRDRLLASEAFHRFAIRFPLTRWVARRQAKSLFDLVAGFVYSQVLFACVRLDLFALLSKGPLSLEDLAVRLNLTTDSAERLMRAAASLKLVELRSDQRWGLGMLGAVLVSNTAVTALIKHHATLYADLRDPVALLRGETDPHLAQYWPYADERAASPTLLPEARVKEYSELMSASQPLIAQEVLSAYAFRAHRCLLDVGGGQGTFLMAAARAFPHLQLMLFDLPAVAGLAEKNFQAAGLSDRARAHGGSFFETPLPKGADLITVLRVLYDHDDHRALAILQAAYHALDPGGTLLVAEPMSETPGAESMGSAYFGFYLLAMGKGRSRSAQRLMQLISQVGFKDARLRSTRLPLQVGLIIAQKEK